MPSGKLTFLGEQIDSKIYQIHMYVNETKREDNCLNTMTFYICFIHLYCGITIVHGGLMFVFFVGISLAHECTSHEPMHNHLLNNYKKNSDYTTNDITSPRTRKKIVDNHEH